MTQHYLIQLEDLQIKVIYRRVKRLRMTIYPPDGEVRIVVPLHTPARTVETFLQDRIPWIRKHQARFRSMPRPEEPTYNDGEILQFWGDPLTLRVRKSSDRRTRVSHDPEESTLFLEIGETDSEERRKKAVDTWYRNQMDSEIQRMVAAWEPVLGVRVVEARIRRMRTLWGSCNIRDRRIWLNSRLVHLPKPALDYVVLHEMAHLLERYHNARFYGILDRTMPDWRTVERALKQIHLRG